MGWLGRRLKTQGLEGPGDGSQSHEVGALVLSTLGLRGAVVGTQVWGRLSSEVKRRVTGPRQAQSEAGWGATGKGDSWHPYASLSTPEPCSDVRSLPLVSAFRVLRASLWYRLKGVTPV